MDRGLFVSRFHRLLVHEGAYSWIGHAWWWCWGWLLGCCWFLLFIKYRNLVWIHKQANPIWKTHIQHNACETYRLRRRHGINTYECLPNIYKFDRFSLFLYLNGEQHRGDSAKTEERERAHTHRTSRFNHIRLPERIPASLVYFVVVIFIFFVCVCVWGVVSIFVVVGTAFHHQAR